MQQIENSGAPPVEAGEREVVEDLGARSLGQSGPPALAATAAPSSAYLYSLAFCSGMSIMAVELCASRLVAPTFGTSTFVWTNIIGVIMIALSVGYMVGGKLADRRSDIHLLLKLLLGACAFLLLLPFLGPLVLRALAAMLLQLHSSFTFLFVGSLLGIALLFAPPVVILGMTSPYLIRVLAQRDPVGASAGRIFGISTIGSVLGTFLPVLVFIPTIGTGRTILIFAAVLFAVAALGFRRRGTGALGVVVIAPFLIPLPESRSTPGRLFAGDSAYQYIEVFDRGDLRCLTYNDAVGVQTVANKAGPLTGMYYDYYALLPLFMDRPVERALLIGLGGGVIANQYRYFHPAVRMEAVEIDPSVIRIARDYFALSDAVQVFDQDGRVFANRCTESYDLVIIDAYAGQIYVPFHLTTREFFGKLEGRLTEGGLVAMNVSASDEDAPLVASICATLRTIFPHVYRMHIPGSYDNVVLASAKPLDFDLPGSYGEVIDRLVAQSRRGFRDDVVTARPLTDDRAPVEHMVDWELLERRPNS